MDKIYEEKGKLLEKAFAELPLDMRMKMRSYAFQLDTTTSAVMLFAILEGYKAVEDLIIDSEDEEEEEEEQYDTV